MKSRTKVTNKNAGKLSRPPAVSDASLKEEEFFSGLKDQIELLKVIALAMGMCAAATIVLASDLGQFTRAIGATTCLVLGVWVGICGVLMYFRHRLKLKGLSSVTKFWRIFQYLFMMCALLFAISTAVEIKNIGSAGTARASNPEQSAHPGT